MTIIVFQKGQTEIEMTGKELNSLDGTFEALPELEKDYADYLEYEKDGDGFPIGFKDGLYRVSRPKHVSLTNPALGDLSFYKIK